MDAGLESWAASGAMALTGRATGAPLGPPAPLVDGVAGAADALRRSSAVIGAEVAVDGLALLGERAALAGLTRRSPISCGGGTRILEAEDGPVAVALARPDDVASVPAWLELAADDLPPPSPGGSDHLAGDGVWATVAAAVRTRPLADLVDRGALLGLAVAGRGDRSRTGPPAGPAFGAWPIGAVAHGPARRSGAVDLADRVVVDLSALWAGPLCGQLLALAGARVIKVESAGRPDAARGGDTGLFDLLNGPKESVALDFTDASDRQRLHALVRAADVVIEASRPRALAQLGIDAGALLTDPGGPAVWVSITGYGRTGPAADRIAYGDVAAFAGGLVVDDDRGPCFCADAVADPLTGLVAAGAALDALASDERWLLDVAMVAVAARWAGPTLATGAIDANETFAVAPPRARRLLAPAPALGTHTGLVLGELVP